MKRKDSRGKGLSCTNPAKANARVPGKGDILTRDSTGTSGICNKQHPEGSRGMHSNQNFNRFLSQEQAASESERRGQRHAKEQQNACNLAHTCTSQGGNASSLISPATLRPCLLAAMIRIGHQFFHLVILRPPVTRTRLLSQNTLRG